MADEQVEESVTLLKKNGQRVPGIKAAVRAKMIFIPDDAVLIEEGDRFTRRTPDGTEERFLVRERGFCPKTGLLPAHYQVKVEQESGAFPNPSTGPASTFPGAAGHAAAAGQLGRMAPKDLFQEVRKVIISNLTKDDYPRWIKAVDEMEKSLETPLYVHAYRRFIALAADRITLIAPYIPPLSSLLT
jgi:hypothetical protein